jgi:hypothetical protein
MERSAFTHSNIHKSILWTPPKTGSAHATFIFTHFDFVTEYFDEESEINNTRIVSQILHHHNCGITERLKGYDVISTTRNPYARLLSGFFYTTKLEKTELNVQNFRKFFVTQIDYPTILSHGYYGYPQIPKHFIRLENLYEDYIKIPFVRDSKLNQCGLLYDLCNKKINDSKKSASTKDFFTMDMVDYLYSNFRNLFDIDGYEKDSYKEYN